MSLRSWCLVIGLGLAGCGAPTGGADEPQTAREKMRLEEKQREKSEDDAPVSNKGKRWGKWRYSGDRDDCFFRFGQKCFKTEKEACSAARCKAPAKCVADGAGPVEVTCVKPEK